MPLIIFSHANSFPASTYRVMFKSLRARGFTVKAIDKLGHDPAYPVTNNWPHLAKQVADFAAAECIEPARGVGVGVPVEENSGLSGVTAAFCRHHSNTCQTLR